MRSPQPKYDTGRTDGRAERRPRVGGPAVRGSAFEHAAIRRAAGVPAATRATARAGVTADRAAPGGARTGHAAAPRPAGAAGAAVCLRSGGVRRRAGIVNVVCAAGGDRQERDEDCCASGLHRASIARHLCLDAGRRARTLVTMRPSTSRLLRIAVLALAALSFAGCEGCDKRQPPVTHLHVDGASPSVALVSVCVGASRCS